jgi:hypothetical protein
MFQTPAPPTLDPGFDSLCYGFNNGKYCEQSRHQMAERALWCAVIEQAFIDMGNIGHAEGRPQARRAAQEFLLNNAKDLTVVCELAGVSAAVIRKAARQMADGRLAFYIPPVGRQGSRNRD